MEKLESDRILAEIAKIHIDMEKARTDIEINNKKIKWYELVIFAAIGGAIATAAIFFTRMFMV